MRLAVGFLLAVTTATAAGARGAEPVDAQVDKIFARWNSTSTPGCAVAAAVDGKRMLAKGYGMADLEHDVRITPDSIFEAGSVAKQFTAAAILLLVREGKLSLDDPARKYLPELPDYGTPVTIRQMLTHTSGLRDWGSVQAIAGWPRTTRAYTHAHVLDIVSRQTSLNFTPGTKWSYSNTGYNLAAIIVSRLSGMPFAEFTRQRIFGPLGMEHTSWRDDFTRVVRNRAIAYAERGGQIHMLMPFENIHGNGGLLTTVHDLLTWNENFVEPKVGDASFVTLQQEPGTFADGRVHAYGMGLMIRTATAPRAVEHSGSTAGYSAHLLRYPDHRISVAVLCNAAGAGASPSAHAVARLLMPSGAAPPDSTSASLARPDGMLYRNVVTGGILPARPDGAWTQEGGNVRLIDPNLNVEAYEQVARVSPTAAQMQDLAGTYVSDEAETTLVAAIEGGALVLKRRPDAVIRLTPEYADAFSAPQLGLVLFRRNASGAVTALSVNQDRVWDLRFVRQAATRSSR